MSHGPPRIERIAVAALLRGYQWAPGLMGRLRPRLVRATWNRAPKWRAAISSNARVIFGEEITEEAIKIFGCAVLENMQRYMADLMAATRSDEAELRARLESASGVGEYLAMRRNGRGAILLSMHMGDFEAAAAFVQKHDAPIHVLYQRDRISLLERSRARVRNRIGVHAHRVDDGLKAWASLNDALERNEVVALQGDRVQPGQRGTKIELLGVMTELPIGPFKLAVSTGAPLVPVFNWRLPSGRYAVRIDAPIPVGEDVLRNPEECEALRVWAGLLGEAIQAHPEQWLNVHAVWDSLH